MNSNYQHAYKLLNLPRSADWRQTKTHYRRLVQIWHPDKFEHDSEEGLSAHKKFLEITQAYDSLQAFYNENKKLPYQPDTLSDSDFLEYQSKNPASFRPRSSPRRRNRTRNNRGKSATGKLSFLIGLIILIFLIMNSSKEASDPLSSAGDISIDEALDNNKSSRSSSWTHQLGSEPVRSNILGAPSRENPAGSHDKGLLFERRD